jgi:hypothetical protein
MCFHWPWKRDTSFPCACDLCGENFFSRATLLEHLGRHDVEDINRNIMEGRGTARCITCYKSFTTTAAMNDHPCVPVIEGLSPIGSCDSLETVLIHDTYSQSN